MCGHFVGLSTSRYQDRLSLYSLTQFFFQFIPSLLNLLFSDMLYTSYLLIYTIYVSIFETTSHTMSNSVVSCNFCDAYSPCVSLGSSSLLSISGSRYVSRQRDSQAFMRISIYSDTLCISSLRLSSMMREERFFTTMITKLMTRSICAWHLRVNYFDINFDIYLDHNYTKYDTWRAFNAIINIGIIHRHVIFPMYLTSPLQLAFLGIGS